MLFKREIFAFLDSCLFGTYNENKLKRTPEITCANDFHHFLKVKNIILGELQQFISFSHACITGI